ncbi:upstream-binding factor 1-like protein 1 isoform 2-T2 [Pholidichthys leucotaenia]
MTDTEMETEEPAAVWTKADVRKLLSAMKSQIPQKEAMYSYARGLKTMNWEEVAFLPFSPQACKQKWNDIFKKMRKVRTLTELIVEAEDDFSLLELATGDGASQPPKPPISGYNLFCKEMTNSMKHIPASKYLKVWSQHWRNLSQKQKDGYSSRCRQLKIQYAADVKEYLKLTEKEQQQYLITNNIKIAKRPKVKFTGEPKMPSR